jgi:hypothetical protein
MHKKHFKANPTNCPKASKISQTASITPILPVPLEGPAYFVSHGNEAGSTIEGGLAWLGNNN